MKTEAEMSYYIIGIKVWALDKQNQHHLEICYYFSRPPEFETLGVGLSNLCITSLSRDSDAAKV